MKVKIDGQTLKSIIREEFILRLRELTEAPKAKVVSAEEDNEDPKKEPGDDAGPAGNVNAPPKSPSKDKKEKDVSEPKSKTAPKDVDAEQQADDALDGSEDIADVTGSKLANQVAGKVIQSLTAKPKSDILPGAQEIVVQFRETPDPLRILVTKMGQVKFFYRGVLTNKV